MSQRKGTISVNTNDILPIIKKWLYSEHDIFIRELVSNACDAITKRANMARMQNLEGADGKVSVEVNPTAKTITIADNGIGMTEEEVEKYIAQLAFSGAEEFANKMQELGQETAREDIIGKFGLGFYSAFMVADKVTVESLSMNEGAKPTKWVSEGSTEYTFEDSTKSEVGTSITLHVNEESLDFLRSNKTKNVLHQYCDFMPYPITYRDTDKVKAEEEQAKKDEKEYIETIEQINETTPLWRRDPKELKDEDYKNFYRRLYPMDEDPLFWLHLRVDHPFNLEGILYFPKLNPNKPVNESNIKLYSKQVYVSDNVKNIIPEFLGMLKGTIDSVDIPLNVSRSALQGDPNIQKISNYVVKKVAESLKKLFKKDREKYEAIWNDIGLFVKYGVVSEPKFDDYMRPYVLHKNSEEKFITLEEYKESTPDAYKEKLGDRVIYFEGHSSDPAIKQQLLQEGLQTIETDGYIDPHFMQHVEMNKKDDKAFQFVGCDAIVEELLGDDTTDAADIKIKDLFTEFLAPKKEGEEEKEEMKDLDIEVKKIKHSSSPAFFKVDEQMKRFQQMTKSMGQNNMAIPLKKTLVVNPANPLVMNALKLFEKGEQKELAGKICHHVKDLATISSEGLDLKDRDAFVARSQTLLSDLSNLII